jgi:hypothetical protein
MFTKCSRGLLFVLFLINLSYKRNINLALCILLASHRIFGWNPRFRRGTQGRKDYLTPSDTLERCDTWFWWIRLGRILQQHQCWQRTFEKQVGVLCSRTFWFALGGNVWEREWIMDDGFLSKGSHIRPYVPDRPIVLFDTAYNRNINRGRDWSKATHSKFHLKPLRFRGKVTKCVFFAHHLFNGLL